MTLTCVLLGSVLLAGAAPATRRVTPFYTNEDLDRVHPLRGETGVLSVPAVPPEAPPSAKRTRVRRDVLAEGDAAAQEAYWRREAQRHRQRIARLERSAAGLKRQIERQRRERSRRQRTDDSLASLGARLSDLESEIAQADSEFEERSRRAGALPGWLR